jgi:hypothetical protein
MRDYRRLTLESFHEAGVVTNNVAYFFGLQNRPMESRLPHPEPTSSQNPLFKLRRSPSERIIILREVTLVFGCTFDGAKEDLSGNKKAKVFLNPVATMSS